MKPTRTKPPKTAALYLRIEPEELATIHAAATKADAESTASWCRRVLAKEAAKVMK